MTLKYKRNKLCLESNLVSSQNFFRSTKKQHCNKKNSQNSLIYTLFSLKLEIAFSLVCRCDYNNN